jgi:uncharacterized repeat protein (TIGR03803 family)
MPFSQVQRATLVSVVLLSAASIAYARPVPSELLQLVLPDLTGGTVEAGSLGLSCAATCSAVVPAGDTIVLTARPAPGRQFEGWSGDCAGWDPTCELLMDGTKMAVATFKPAGDRFTVIHRFLPGTPFGGSLGGGELLADAGYLFGFTSRGGRADRGTIFREALDGREHTVLHEFSGSNSEGSPSSLVALGGVLFGSTRTGGAHGRGSVFRLNEDGSGFTLLRSFSGGANEGAYPTSIVVVGGVIYGTTTGGGAFDRGTVFRLGPGGDNLTLLHSFSGGRADGANPFDTLVATGGVLFGVTYGGGTLDLGTVFRIAPDGSGFALVHVFGDSSAAGAHPSGSLVEVGGALYGVCSSGGAHWDGAIFRVNPDGTGYALVRSFGAPGTVGSQPVGPLVPVGGALYGVVSETTNDAYGGVFRIAPDGSDYSLIHSFVGGGTDGADPCSPLLVLDAALVGMTSSFGGPDSPDYGTVFRVDLDGSGFVLLHTFERAVSAGASPMGSLTELNGLLYGTTAGGGTSASGTVFGVKPDGTGYTVVHTFSGYPDDMGTPLGSLLASGDELYGMTSAGGGDYGTVFRLRTDGSAYEILHSFTARGGDGARPRGSLLLAEGILYGTTQYGGAGSCPDAGAPPMTTCGTVFRINTDGSNFAIVHSFRQSSADGRSPTTSLVLHRRVLYGLTDRGGAFDRGVVYKVNPNGTGFALLHSFGGGGGDGAYPSGALVQSGGFLYGVTIGGGLDDRGAVFRIRPDGSGFALVHVFAGDGSEGGNPPGPVVAAGGALYGTTLSGGPHGAGAAFRVNEDGTGFTVLHAFSGADGSAPRSLTAVGRSLCGVATSGGLADAGVLFRLDMLPMPIRRRIPATSRR